MDGCRAGIDFRVNIVCGYVSTLQATDQTHLSRAIELAEGGRGRTSPNPLVGAVIVRDGRVLGEGFHTAVGSPHAEREAIAAAGGADLGGATMYVSLEPCCHTGRTPPCTDAIIAAGISRVVVASDDPTEKAAGRGLGILRDEGITVELADGELAARARLLNQPFRKHARTGRPFVLFKSAMTLDGKVATRTGDSKWISGEDSRRLSHRWRAEVDAVVVGIGTALTDDPQLTARIEGVTRQPRRIVFDSEARLPLDSQLVRGAAEVPLTVVVTRAAPRTAVDALEIGGADVIVATGANEPDRVRNALVQLGAGGVTSILLEGGPHLAGAFLDAGEVDEIRLFVAPVVLGGSSARDPLEGEGAERIASALRALSLECGRVAEDVLITARMREW
jgi:diaminohydroxyphosphoribosylaminopyrimidine deaminase/5-amino-6-(5-phosphoribosylamino)uracil reductase